MLRKLWLPLLLVTVSSASAQESRHFTFHYGFTVKNVPAGREGPDMGSSSAFGRISGSKSNFGFR